MAANCNATPLLKAIFFDYRFDLTKNTPPPPSQNFMGANCNATPPLLKAIFFNYRFDLTKNTPPPPGQNFMGAFCHHYTCVKWFFRSMQIWLDIFDPPLQNFTGCISSHYTTAVQPISIQPLQTQQKPRVTEAQHNAEKHYLLTIFISWKWRTDVLFLDIHIRKKPVTFDLNCIINLRTTCLWRGRWTGWLFAFV